MTDERSAAAHHEAGHAVAATMRGGASLTSVRLGGHGAGITWTRVRPWDRGFVAWAGPWAEARWRWGLDDEGLTLDDYVTGALLTQPDDMAVVAAAYATPEDVWAYEMERVWPAVAAVARALRRGRPVTDETVRRAVTRAS